MAGAEALWGTRRGLLVGTGGKRRSVSFLRSSQSENVRRRRVYRQRVHDRGEVVHIAMVRGVADVLALRVESVDLLLKGGIRLRVREEAVEDARDRAGARV